mmetsp:Transcript_5641/g.16198  ORF Transcript_5641/g.16198 Transcript_5641/m.16198 type:complete len:234 (+) Transcript_5641:373-1074(+)
MACRGRSTIIRPPVRPRYHCLLHISQSLPERVRCLRNLLTAAELESHDKTHSTEHPQGDHSGHRVLWAWNFLLPDRSLRDFRPPRRHFKDEQDDTGDHRSRHLVLVRRYPDDCAGGGLRPGPSPASHWDHAINVWWEVTDTDALLCAHRLHLHAGMAPGLCVLYDVLVSGGIHVRHSKNGGVKDLHGFGPTPGLCVLWLFLDQTRRQDIISRFLKVPVLPGVLVWWGVLGFRC